MADNPCTICGAPLSLREGRAFCSNDECSSGGLFLRCGYCRRYSFSIHPDQMSCSNSNCHMTGIKRSYCQHCGKTSQVSTLGQSICVNRNCKSNAKVIGHCFFCGKKAFLKIPEIMVCTKGDCPYILQRMEPCFHCKAIAFDFKGKVCRSAECEYHEVKIGSCSTCGVVSRILRQDHKHAEKCSNKECADYYDAPAPSPPTAAPQGSPLKNVVSEKDATQIIREKVLATETELDVPIQSIEDEEPPESPPPSQHGDDFEIALPRSITKPREPPTRVSPSGRLVPVAPPEAPPPTPSRFAPAGMLERPSTEESLRSVYQFLRDQVLTDEKGVSTSLFTVMGLSGSGKTTYLSALGDILAHRGVRYHYPWSGVDVKRFDVEKVIEERSQSGADSSRLPSAIDVHPLLKDLAFDFASEQISGFLSKGQWARP
ncbi:MAG: hypothetical protein O6952_08165, partial [Planctomycetota bacterium]|nr:hypothetical protein [Planctomycetota bacterium]